jgi:hypothetical protein
MLFHSYPVTNAYIRLQAVNIRLSNLKFGTCNGEGIVYSPFLSDFSGRGDAVNDVTNLWADEQAIRFNSSLAPPLRGFRFYPCRDSRSFCYFSSPNVQFPIAIGAPVNN